MRKPNFWIIRPCGSTIATMLPEPRPLMRIIDNPPHWGVEDVGGDDVITIHFWQPSWKIFRIDEMEHDWWYPVWVEVNPGL